MMIAVWSRQQKVKFWSMWQSREDEKIMMTSTVNGKRWLCLWMKIRISSFFDTNHRPPSPLIAWRSHFYGDPKKKMPSAWYKHNNIHTTMGSYATKPASSSPLQDSNALDFINTSISAHQVVIFSKTWCGTSRPSPESQYRHTHSLCCFFLWWHCSGYCSKTKQLFGKLNEANDVKVIELDTRSDGNQIQEALATQTGQRTVPNVFINQQHVGGCDDTFSLFNSGELVKMLLKQLK